MKETKMREEMQDSSVDGFRVNQFVKNVLSNRLARIHRFITLNGMRYADIRYWRERPTSSIKDVLVMVPLVHLEPADDPREEETP